MTIPPLVSPITPTPDSVAFTPPAGAALTRHLVRNALAQHLADSLAPIPVFMTRVAPLQPDERTTVSIFALGEKKQFESRVGGDFYYRPLIAIIIQAAVARASQAQAEADLDALNLLIEEAVLRDASWMQSHWSPADITVETRFRLEGDRPMGELVMTLDIQVSEENFTPIIPDTLATVAVEVDAIDPADPLGAYPGAPAPPRPTGPDGRAEIGANIAIPQT